MQIRVTLDEEQSKKFEGIREYYGLKNATETVRFCINNEHRRLFPNNPNNPNPKLKKKAPI